jgi:hypothetical protein
MGAPKRSMIYGFGKRSWRKSVCDCQRCQLICLQSYLLCEHDVTRHQIAFGHETPSHLRIAGLVHLSNVGRVAIKDAVSFAGAAADNVEEIHRVKLRALFLRKPMPQEAHPRRFSSVSPADRSVKSPERARTRRIGRPAQEAQQKVHWYR